MDWPRFADAVLRDALPMGFNKRPLVDVTGDDCVSVNLGKVLSELTSPASGATAAAETVVIPEAMKCRLPAALCSE
jgi:hypothetical protein